jgi:hypothetical protein
VIVWTAADLQLQFRQRRSWRGVYEGDVDGKGAALWSQKGRARALRVQLVIVWTAADLQLQSSQNGSWCCVYEGGVELPCGVKRGVHVP